MSRKEIGGFFIKSKKDIFVAVAPYSDYFINYILLMNDDLLNILLLASMVSYILLAWVATYHSWREYRYSKLYLIVIVLLSGVPFMIFPWLRVCEKRTLLNSKKRIEGEASLQLNRYKTVFSWSIPIFMLALWVLFYLVLLGVAISDPSLTWKFALLFTLLATLFYSVIALVIICKIEQRLAQVYHKNNFDFLY